LLCRHPARSRLGIRTWSPVLCALLWESSVRSRSDRLERYSNRGMYRYPAWSASKRASDKSKAADPNRYLQIIHPRREMEAGLKTLRLVPPPRPLSSTECGPGETRSDSHIPRKFPGPFPPNSHVVRSPRSRGDETGQSDNLRHEAEASRSFGARICSFILAKSCKHCCRFGRSERETSLTGQQGRFGRAEAPPARPTMSRAARPARRTAARAERRCLGPRR
jgi:hypothetical protein